ncbi:MAG: hypothetical protein K1W19_08625 [Lachnospiraceae bacterium]
MKMNNEKKKEVLLKNFEIIDKNFGENGKSLAEIINKMFSIDTEMAFDMWEHLITKYEDELKTWNSSYLTEEIYRESRSTIGDGIMESNILNRPILKKALFSLTCHIDRTACIIVDHIIKQNNIQLANELLQLLYDNPNIDWTWYHVMCEVLPYNCDNMDDEMYELLEIWCDKVENEEERAKLSIKMLNYID